jgi:hypothetical protein
MKERRARSFALGPQDSFGVVEASFFLDFLDTFSSRKKFQYLIAKGKKSNFPVVGDKTNLRKCRNLPFSRRGAFVIKTQSCF